MIVFCLLCWEGRWLYIAVTYTQGHFSFLFSLLEELTVFRMFYRVASFPSLNVRGSRFSWLHCLGLLAPYLWRASQPLRPLTPRPLPHHLTAQVLLSSSCPPQAECWHLERPPCHHWWRHRSSSMHRPPCPPHSDGSPEADSSGHFPA